MKFPYCIQLTLAALLAAMPLTGKATVFFSDTFTNGSTINSTSPANPTPTNTAYQQISAKTFVPNPPTISSTSSDLRFGIASTSSGVFEIQTLFATNPIALVLPGDYIQLTIVFTNTTGLLALPGPGASQLGVGLYNSGQVKPLPGGTNATTTLTLSGYAQNWQGYVGQIVSGANKIMTRPSQVSAIDGWNQELVCSGSSTSTYRNQVTVGSTAGTVTLTTNSPYTEVLYITMNDVNSLAITNTLYAGPDTSGTVLMSSGGIATNTTFLTGGFDAFALGYQTKVAGNPSLFDVSSVQVVGSVTPVTGPPTITTEPVAATVATGGACEFTLVANGYNMTYQWKRYGTNLLNVGNISGATAPTLIINNASATDVASGANGYYCVVSGAGNFSTNSFTNSLALVTAKNLIWNGNGSMWDLNTSANWNDANNGNNPATFNYGDAVTFDDTGAANSAVTLSGSFLSASKCLITGSANYTFSGTGSMAGSGKLIFNSAAAGNLQLNVANTHTGGTIVSNSNPSLSLYIQQYQVFGNGPLTLATPGMIEFTSSGSAAVGIAGDVAVNDDFTMQFDGTGTYAGVFLGNISGVTGKTLTLAPQTVSNVDRFRLYATNTVCNANIALNPNGIPTSTAQYDGTVLAPYGSTGVQTYNGVISGYGGIIQRGTGSTILNGVNTYSGGTSPTAGGIGLGNDAALGTGPLNLVPETGSATGTGTIFASGAARTIATTIQYPSGTNNLTLVISGTNNITFTSDINLAGVDGQGNPTNRTIQAINTGATTFSGAISDNSGNNIGLIKTGTNTLYLNGANTFPGRTTVSAGTLAGSGSLAGSVLVTTNAAIGAGAATGIGTLTITGNLTFTNANGFFRVNRAGLQSDLVSVAGGLTNTGVGANLGTITITNLGATLQVGDKFTLFSEKMTGGAALTVTGGGVVWNNGLAVDGSVTVLPSAPPTIITQPTNRAVAQGSSVTLSVTVSTVTGVTNYAWQFNSNNITAGNVTGTNTSTLTITNFQGTNAGYYRVLVGDGNNSTTSTNADLTLAVAPTIGTSGVSGTTLTLQIPTQVGPTYLVQTNSNLATTNWQTAATLIGDGTTKPFATSVTSSPQLFIRVKMQ